MGAFSDAPDELAVAIAEFWPREEWDNAAALLADRRRSRVGAPQDSVKRWRDTCLIAELTPLVTA